MICIFNPEHDLCLANGSSNYMPPESALQFADRDALLMQVLYPQADRCCSARQYVAQPSQVGEPVVAWGWNSVLKTQLLKAGVEERYLPTDERIEAIRRLQHRTTFLPLQPQSRAVTQMAEVEEMLSVCHDVVMKAPWSGAGRGLRWVKETMSPHDQSWMTKVVRQQGCVIVEPRREVLHDFAIEYHSDGTELRREGYSLFVSANGVYQHNLLLPDEKIVGMTGFSIAQRDLLEAWLRKTVVPHYAGPLGVDLLHTPEGCFFSELNLRHTMGMVACRRRSQTSSLFI